MRSAGLAAVIFTIVVGWMSPENIMAEDSRFRLGVSCPLSGVLAEYGTAVRNGIELARRENPQRFSAVEIVFEDSQMQAQDLRRASFGPDFLDSSRELQAAGPAVEGAFHPNFDVVESFRVKYQAQFGNDAQIPFAANAYDVANIVGELFGSATQTRMSADAVMDAIRGVRDYEGANGTMSVRRGESGDVYFEYPLVTKEARHGASITLRN